MYLDKKVDEDAVWYIGRQVMVKDECAYRWEGKLMRMHTAVQLNHAIRERSSQAQIVIVNFPAPPSKFAAEENCFLLRRRCFVVLLCTYKKKIKSFPSFIGQ